MADGPSTESAQYDGVNGGMSGREGPVLDKPWRRPAAVSYAFRRLVGVVRPPVRVYEPDLSRIAVDRNVGVAVRDGTILRVNVYRPTSPDPAPVLLSAHPYGKDDLPVRGRFGYRVNVQYRALRQTGPVRFSCLTGWEAPDPAWWVARGYAVVNADLRGAGTSEGVGELCSDQEGEDVYDLIEWAARQPWSNGRVGMLGVSYLAMSQYKAAALGPPGLAAICPWEGFTDAYRDVIRPGGIRETGFMAMWARALRTARLRVDLRAERDHRPLRDDWWASLAPDLEKIETPMLVCASFSDNNLHGRGSFRAFQRVSSADKYAYTHRSGKWATFYSEEGLDAQLAFFERYLRRVVTTDPPRIRLEVRETRDRVAAVRSESDWPLTRTRWTRLHLGSNGKLRDQPTEPGSVRFRVPSRAAQFCWTFPADQELTGPMAARLWLESPDAQDLCLFVGVEKWRNGRYEPFEGSYGFGRDRVTTGWLRASLRALDASLSSADNPVQTFRTPEPLLPGTVVAVDVALGPSATLFRAGEQLRLVVGGRWLWPTNPLTGQFPARYEQPPKANCILHWAEDRPSHLLVPVIPALDSTD